MEVALIAVVVVEDPLAGIWISFLISTEERRWANGSGLSAWNVANANPYVY
jgi:hypothetical protein